MSPCLFRSQTCLVAPTSQPLLCPSFLAIPVFLWWIDQLSNVINQWLVFSYGRGPSPALPHTLSFLLSSLMETASFLNCHVFPLPEDPSVLISLFFFWLDISHPSILLLLPSFFLLFFFFATVAVFSVKDFGTSEPSIMHSHNQLLTNRRSSRSHRLVSSPDPYMPPSLFLSVWALCSSVMCVGVFVCVALISSVGLHHCV